jgi:hypothetical protein
MSSKVYILSVILFFLAGLGVSLAAQDFDAGTKARAFSRACGAAAAIPGKSHQMCAVPHSKQQPKSDNAGTKLAVEILTCYCSNSCGSRCAHTCAAAKGEVLNFWPNCGSVDCEINGC